VTGNVHADHRLAAGLEDVSRTDSGAGAEAFAVLVGAQNRRFAPDRDYRTSWRGV
jgi:hypothetical protein